VKILSVVGARPDFVTIAPLLGAMARRPRIASVRVHSGQRYGADTSDEFVEALAVPAPDVHLGVGAASHGHQPAEAVEAGLRSFDRRTLAGPPAAPRRPPLREGAAAERILDVVQQVSSEPDASPGRSTWRTT
jgi:UDP-N-acetylglucosamine 2-epimerase